MVMRLFKKRTGGARQGSLPAPTHKEPDFLPLQTRLLQTKLWRDAVTGEYQGFRAVYKDHGYYMLQEIRVREDRTSYTTISAQQDDDCIKIGDYYCYGLATIAKRFHAFENTMRQISDEQEILLDPIHYNEEDHYKQVLIEKEKLAVDMSNGNLHPIENGQIIGEGNFDSATLSMIRALALHDASRSGKLQMPMLSAAINRHIELITSDEQLLKILEEDKKAADDLIQNYAHSKTYSYIARQANGINASLKLLRENAPPLTPETSAETFNHRSKVDSPPLLHNMTTEELLKTLSEQLEAYMPTLIGLKLYSGVLKNKVRFENNHGYYYESFEKFNKRRSEASLATASEELWIQIQKQTKPIMKDFYDLNDNISKNQIVYIWANIAQTLKAIIDKQPDLVINPEAYNDHLTRLIEDKKDYDDYSRHARSSYDGDYRRPIRTPPKDAHSLVAQKILTGLENDALGLRHVVANLNVVEVKEKIRYGKYSHHDYYRYNCLNPIALVDLHKEICKVVTTLSKELNVDMIDQNHLRSALVNHNIRLEMDCIPYEAAIDEMIKKCNKLADRYAKASDLLAPVLLPVIGDSAKTLTAPTLR